MQSQRFPIRAAAVCATALVAAALAAVRPADAASVLQRCESADGAVAYTDRACADGSLPRPVPTDLRNRIDREALTAEQAAVAHSAAATMPAAGATGAGTTTRTHARRAPASGCARSTSQLRMNLEDAIAMGDVNRAAESFHWAGMSASQSMPVMQRLDRLVVEPLLQAHYFDARILEAHAGDRQVADAGGAAPGGSAGMLQVVSGEPGDPSALELQVERYRGCYFVRF